MKSLYVRANYEVNQSVWCRILSEAQCEEIYYAALEVMERTGVDIYDPGTIEVLKKGGCWVDGKRVRFPSGLVEWAIRTAPSRVVLCDRDGNRKLFLEGKNVYYGPGPTNTFTRDPFTGERRRPVKQDAVWAGLCCDALPNIDYAMDLGTPTDVTPTLSDVHAYEALLLNTTKPIVHWGFDVEQYQDIVDMSIAIAGSLEELQKRPFLCLYSESSPPLQHSREAIAKAMFVAEKGLPLIYTPCTMAGATSPATMAGTIVITIVESLVGLVAAQLKRNGTPFIMGGLISIMDMSSTILAYGSPEFSLLAAGLANVAQFMKIPMFSTAGCTDSKCMDAQAGIESAFSILAAALSGANLVHDVGYSEYGATGSTEQMVMGDEVIGMVKRIMRGIEVNDEMLAVDVIDNVGPGGHFLGEAHTMSHFKTETWFPTLISRVRYDDWVASGSTTMGDRIKKKTQKIITEHKAKELPAGMVAKIKDVVAKAEKREAEKASRKGK